MLRFVFAACLAALPAAPGALALTADEASVAPGGDFSNGSGATSTLIGSLDAGINTVSGRISGECTAETGGPRCTTGDVQDSLRFVIDPGFTLTGIDVLVGAGTAPAGFDVQFSIVDRAISLFAIDLVAAPVSGSDVLTFAPLGPSTYNFNVVARSASEPGPFDVPWSAEFTVEGPAGAAVPTPAAAPLLLLGLAALGAVLVDWWVLRPHTARAGGAA